MIATKARIIGGNGRFRTICWCGDVGNIVYSYRVALESPKHTRRDPRKTWGGACAVSDKFRIHKYDYGYHVPWKLDYPAGFDESVGEDCETFDLAATAFIEASERQCPMCLKGAVVSTDWGWRCEACGSYDVAVGCEAPPEAAEWAWRGNEAANRGCSA